VPRSESKCTSFRRASKFSDIIAICKELFFLASTALMSHLSSKARYMKISYSRILIASKSGVNRSILVGSSLI